MTENAERAKDMEVNSAVNADNAADVETPAKAAGRGGKKRQLIFRAGALLIVLAIAACMFVIGRGHTVYFDNKTLEYNGQTYEAFHKVNVLVDGERVAKLSKKDRGMTDTMGQTFKMVVEITDAKGAEPHSHAVTMTLPYGMDGIIVNLPALLAGLPEEAWLSEFEAAPVTETEEETVEGGDAVPGMDGLGGDEFGIGSEEGSSEGE